MSTTQNAALSVTYTSFSAPAGSVVDHITFSAVASNPANNPPSQNVPPETASVTFGNLNPDTYTFSAQAFSSGGEGFGTLATVTLTVVSTAPVILSVPGTLTATQP